MRRFLVVMVVVAGCGGKEDPRTVTPDYVIASVCSGTAYLPDLAPAWNFTVKEAHPDTARAATAVNIQVTNDADAEQVSFREASPPSPGAEFVISVRVIGTATDRFHVAIRTTGGEGHYGTMPTVIPCL